MARKPAPAAPDAAPIAGPFYVCRTLFYFGGAATVDGARIACRKAGGGRYLRTHGYVIHRLPDGITAWGVSDGGRLTWSGGAAGATPTLITDARTLRARAQKAVSL